MLGTYASFLVILGACVLVGQAILVACGRRPRWSWLAPATGLAALCALAWWTVRLPGEGTAALIAIAVAAAASALYLRGRVATRDGALKWGIWVGLAALVLASLPFVVEGRFGILGTGLNPDMSQHLFAADRLASGGSERLIAEGYPLGPHAIVVAVSALGPTTVQAFDGLTLAVAVAACLAPLALLDLVGGWKRFAAALWIGFAYLVAAYLVQGAFKETMQALFLLAFAIGLLCLAGRRPAAGDRGTPDLLAAVPLAVLAVGSVYTYSFPGLAWLVGAVAVWALVELVRAAGEGRRALPGTCCAERRRRRWSRSRYWRWRPSPRRADSSTSPASRPSTPTARASATSSTACRRWRRSGSGPRGTFGSSPATAPSRRSSSTSARRSERRRWASGSGGGGGAASAPSRPRSQPPSCCGSTRWSPARRTRRPRRWSSRRRSSRSSRRGRSSPGRRR